MVDVKILPFADTATSPIKSLDIFGRKPAHQSNFLNDGPVCCGWKVNCERAHVTKTTVEIGQVTRAGEGQLAKGKDNTDTSRRQRFVLKLDGGVKLNLFL